MHLLSSEFAPHPSFPTMPLPREVMVPITVNLLEQLPNYSVDRYPIRGVYYALLIEAAALTLALTIWSMV